MFQIETPKPFVTWVIWGDIAFAIGSKDIRIVGPEFWAKFK